MARPTRPNSGREAIVLAGGLGTRLRTVVPDLPKALAPVAGRPFLEWLLLDLANQGITRTIVAVGYLHEQIQQHFGTSFGAMSLEYSVEHSQLGTGGAIRQAMSYAASSEVFVLNGDSFVDVSLERMRDAHRAAEATLSVATRAVPDTGRYGRVLLEANRRIVGFAEKGVAGPGDINAGVYLLRNDLLGSFELPRVFSFELDFLAAHVSELKPLAFPVEGMFIDIGVPADYERAQALFGAR